ncbi:hypothetical protein [Pluralibacter gergoviae]|uniref:hypothetical protein n=1 Tax=Pluralibacter gergoviae TaxID=61647 RepID=UPI00069E04FD|nr:hypothetical protein [Pluralibacter gergoviae]MBK4118793.1 hypothetical protein [Pluralibacter gergoviae]HDY9258279.1 hypothetical protein [Klebsiella pneumoniae]
MKRLDDITEDTYFGYGFNRQDLTDFFYGKGKAIDFGLPPMVFEECHTDSTVEAESITLDEALIEIERLKQTIAELELRLPIFLGEFRDDDPLKIAIQIRHQEWRGYDPENRKTIPSQEGLIAQIVDENKAFDMKDAQARAIEKVACPIKRK